MHHINLKANVTTRLSESTTQLELFMRLTKTDIEVIKKTAKSYQTPLYLYRADSIEKEYKSLRDGLPGNVDIFYSIKANPNIAICCLLKSLGACAELCSYYEIQAAICAGFDPLNIIFVGPAKSERELEKCLDLDIYAIICESLMELERISLMAIKKNKIARVAIRINPSHISKTALLKMGGKPSQFGMDEEVVFGNKEKFLKARNVKIIGIHVYNGTRILDADTVIENTKYILSLAAKLQRSWGLDFEMVDVGGGLGIPYFENEPELDLNKLTMGLTQLIGRYAEKYSNTRIVLESGRFLVASCGMMISKIVDIKVSKGINMIVTDGGINCHMAAVGIGGVVKRNFPISLVQSDKRQISEKHQYNITGPLCTPGDLVGKNVTLPKAKIDDLIVIHRSGAYGPSASPVMFLSHGYPAEALYKGKRVTLIGERFGGDHFFNRQPTVEEA